MAEERIKRKLAAILAADVVGFSNLMDCDEEGALAALKRHRETVFDPAVAAHNGRIVKLIGDGTIVEFDSVVDAVNCALSVQRSGNSLLDERLHQPTIILRIGINLGDVIIEGDDIYGDGVNIAARLEPVAEPGGICISSIVSESISNRIDARFHDGGEIKVKNIERPIRIWRWHPLSARATAINGQRSNAANPAPRTTSASVAILPFVNMSGDPEQEYFSDGISEDIITDLSKIAGLRVIARFLSAGLSVTRSASTMRCVTSSWTAKISVKSRSYRSAQRCPPLAASMSCALILTRLPARRIEPSRTDCTPSSRPMVRTSTERPL